MQIFFAGTMVEERSVVVLMVGEAAPFMGSCEVVSGDAEGATIAGGAITFASAGPRALRLSGGMAVAEVRVIVCEQAALDRVHIDNQHVGPGDSIPAARRRVLKALALHGGWDGTVAGLSGKNLCHFGASQRPAGGAVPL